MRSILAKINFLSLFMEWFNCHGLYLSFESLKVCNNKTIRVYCIGERHGTKERNQTVQFLFWSLVYTLVYFCCCYLLFVFIYLSEYWKLSFPGLLITSSSRVSRLTQFKATFFSPTRLRKIKINSWCWWSCKSILSMSTVTGFLLCN